MPSNLNSTQSKQSLELIECSKNGSNGNCFVSLTCKETLTSSTKLSKDIVQQRLEESVGGKVGFNN